MSESAVIASWPREIIVIMVRQDLVPELLKVQLEPGQSAAAYMDNLGAQENTKKEGWRYVWVPIEASDSEEEKIKKAFSAGVSFLAFYRGEWAEEDK